MHLHLLLLLGLQCWASLPSVRASDGMADWTGDTALAPLPTMAFALNMRVSDKEWDSAASDIRKLLDYALENKMTTNIEAMLRAGLEKVAAATITVKEKREKDAAAKMAKVTCTLTIISSCAVLRSCSCVTWHFTR